MREKRNIYSINKEKRKLPKKEKVKKSKKSFLTPKKVKSRVKGDI
jgi:hypothetical protein